MFSLFTNIFWKYNRCVCLMCFPLIFYDSIAYCRLVLRHMQHNFSPTVTMWPLAYGKIRVTLASCRASFVRNTIYVMSLLIESDMFVYHLVIRIKNRCFITFVYYSTVSGSTEMNGPKTIRMVTRATLENLEDKPSTWNRKKAPHRPAPI